MVSAAPASQRLLSAAEYANTSHRRIDPSCLSHDPVSCRPARTRTNSLRVLSPHRLAIQPEAGPSLMSSQLGIVLAVALC
jgi:hypothetical protein